MRKGWAALGKKCNAYFGKSVAFLLFIAAILAGAAPAAAQSTCTVTSADLPSLEVAAGSSNNVIISSLGFNTPARNAILTKCGFTTSGGLRYRNVDANSNVSTGNTTFNLVTGSTLVHGVGLSFTYTPAAGLTGTENVSPTVATGSFAGQTIRLEAAADIALATPITVVTLQVTITGGTPAPTVTAVSPNAGSTAGGTVVTLTGTDFTGVTGVSFGASPAASFTFNNATSITATTPPGAAGTVNARVTTPGGTSATAAANQFTYVVPAPTVTAVSPSSGSTAGGTVVTLTGTDFTGATAVSFGATNAVGFTVNSATSITATAPSGGAGTVNVRVTTPGGTSATGAANQFTYVAPTLTLSPTALTAPVYGTAYSQTITASGGNGNYSFAVTVGTLPAGLSLSSGGVLSGTPTVTGSFNFTITATDTSPTPVIGSRPYSVTIAAPTITLVTSDLAPVPPSVGNSYTAPAINVTGGIAPYSFAVTGGTLPPGMTVSNAGVFSGTATAGGSFSFTVTATDAGGFSGSRSYSVPIAAPTLVITPGTLPNATGGSAYSQTLAVTGGGTAPFTWAVTGGALPAGLTLSSAGVLSGTPTVSGSFNFTVTATDSSTGTGPYSGSQAYTLGVDAPAITLAPTALPASRVGTGYSAAISASGGSGPYTFAVTAGSLPAGLTLATDGQISGTPTAGGTFGFTVTATDSLGFTGTRAYTLTVDPPIIGLTGPANAPGTVGTAFSITISASGGTAPYSFSLGGGTLPPGLSLGTNGTLSGTPTTSGTYDATIVATDSSTGTGPYNGTFALRVTIGEAPPVAGAVSATVAYNAAATPITLALSGGPATDVTVASPAANGTTSAVGTSISYTPNRDYVGPDSFTYTATGPGGTSAPATVTITVAPPPAPSATNRSGVIVGYNSGGTAIDLSGNVSGVVSSIELASNPAHGTAQVSGTTVTYTPVTDYFGSDSFTFVAVGPGGRSSPATVSLTVETPPAPTAAAVSATTPYETAAQIDLAPSVSGVATSVAIVTGPANGTASLSGQVITYTPNAGYFGSDEITYTATGPGGTSDPATISITVGLPPAPTAAGTTVSTPFETAATIDTAPLVTGVSRSIAIASAPTHGTASVSGSVITYTPSTDYDGPDSFTYTATGPGGTSAPATVNVTVEPLPPPEPAARQLSTDSTTPVSVDVTTGLRGAPFTVAIATPPPSGQASVQGGVITFTPASDSPANVRFTFTVTSRFGTSQPTEINVAVRLIPVPVRQRNLQALAGTTVSQSLTEGATGGPFTAATIVTTVDPSAGTATIVRNGGTFTLNFAAASTFAGTVRIGYTLSNAVATSEVAFVDVTVTARPDPTDDPTVRGIIDAQVQATQRFATGQIRNIGSRLEQLHDGGGSGFNSRLGVGGNLFTHYALNDPALLDPFTSFNPGAQLAYQNANVISDRPAGVLGGAFGGALTANGQGGGRSAGGIGGAGAAAAADAEGAPSGGSDEVNPFGLWIGGTIEFGNREREDGRRDFTFTTGGITAGLDYRFSDTFILGASVGYGRDQSDVGRDLGDVTSDSWSGAVYASAQPAPNLFIDGLVGYGWMTFDTRRVVTETGNEVRGERDGEQVFTSVNVTYEYRGKRWWIAPYGRLDYVGSTLFEYAETGDPVYALRTLNQSSDLVTGATGVRVRYRVPLGRGFLTPTGRAEFQYDLTESGIARLRYADLADGLVYSFSPQRYDRARALLGAGLSYSGPGGAQLKLDYEGTLLDNGSNHLIRVTAGIRF